MKGESVKEMTNADIAEQNESLDLGTVFSNAKPTSGIPPMHHMMKVINSPHAELYTLSKDKFGAAMWMYPDLKAT